MGAENIIIGKGRFYVSPVATAKPDESTVAYAAAWSSWTDMGKMLDGKGVAFNLGDAYKETFTEDNLGPERVTRTKRRPMFKVSLAEFTSANLEKVLGATATTTAAAGGGQKGYFEVGIGDDPNVTLYQFGMEGVRYDTSGNEQPVRYFIHKGYIASVGDIVHAKATESEIVLEIVALADPDAASAASRYGLIQYVTAQATAT